MRIEAEPVVAGDDGHLRLDGGSDGSNTNDWFDERLDEASTALDLTRASAELTELLTLNLEQSGMLA